MFGLERRRRQRIRRQAMPPAWVEIIRRNVPYCRFLTPAERVELHGHVQVFLAEKRFEGCGGLQITDEIRVTIAAHACILLLGRQTDYYPRTETILVYPEDYEVATGERLPGGLEVEGTEERAGESWYRGPVVLSWDDVRHSAEDARDGFNVVFHEFAHQLDSEDGRMDGTPVLSRRSMYPAWAEVLQREYNRLREDLRRGRRTLLDEYAATDPAEFFAVATETFFTRPGALRRKHPELYEQLKAFYRQDPAERAAARSRPGRM